MVLIAPCTTADRGLPHHVELDWRAVGLARPTWVRTEDVRAVSDRRLQGQRPLGSVTDSDLTTVKQFLRLMLNL
jgi:mRNA-degrading endonuclease toxin of MazEF toxin-antitoxin module